MTIIKGKALRNDHRLYDGVEKTASRRDSTGGTLTGLKVGYEVDVLSVYGKGTEYTVDTITNAVNAIGSANVTLTFNPGTWTIDSDLTIASNFVCRIPAGCVFNVSSGKTLTFSGPVIQDHGTWTSGSGTVTTNGTRTINGSETLSGNLSVSGTLTLAGTALTATFAELNTLDGITSTVSELNLVDGQVGALFLNAFATAAGTVNAITADFTPNVALTDGVTVLVEATGANTSTTVTFSPDSLTAHNITKNGNQNLDIGDIYGAGHRLILSYDSANTVWELLNPVNTTKNNFVSKSTGEALIDTTIISVSGLTISTWVDVGPTGSGSTQIWSALDVVPTDADWIEIMLQLTGDSTTDTAALKRTLNVAARKNGSSATYSVNTIVAQIAAYTDSSGNGYSTSAVRTKVPISSAIFDIYWVGTFSTTNSVSMFLTGYGYN